MSNQKRVLGVPEAYWERQARRARDRYLGGWFRQEGRMVHEFVHAVASGQPVTPDFDDGARVQLLLDAAVASAESGCWVGTARRALISVLNILLAQ